MTNCDFLVIGAGMAGASAAYELAELGSVILIEREDMPGYHTTGRSAAVFTEAYGNRTIRGITARLPRRPGPAVCDGLPAGVEPRHVVGVVVDVQLGIEKSWLLTF